jgi:Tfp pilus assembly protein PilV
MTNITLRHKERKEGLLSTNMPICPDHRKNAGSFLIEAVVAVLVSSLIALALCNMYMQTRRVSNMSQGQLVATALAQECVDHLRVMNFAAVTAATPSVHYGSLYTPSADALFPRALLVDPSLDYTNQGDGIVANASTSDFHALNPDTNVADDKVKIELQSAAGNCVQVIVTIHWRDTSTAIKSYRLTSVLTQNGLGS